MVHSLGTVSSKAITTNVQVLRRHVILKPVGCIPRCDMTMPYASSNLSCCFVAAVLVLRTLHTDLHRGQISLQLSQQDGEIPSPHTLSSLCCCLFSQGHSFFRGSSYCNCNSHFLEAKGDGLFLIYLLVLCPWCLRMLCCFPVCWLDGSGF